MRNSCAGLRPGRIIRPLVRARRLNRKARRPGGCTAWRRPLTLRSRDGFIWFERQARAVARGQAARADPWLHYAQRRVRGRARLRRRDLRAHRAQPAPARIAPRCLDFEIPYTRRRDRPGLPRGRRGRTGSTDGYVRPDRLARQRDDGRLGAGDQDQSRHRRLGLGLLLRSVGAAAQGHPPRPSPNTAGPTRAPPRRRPRPPAST